ncbi:hypothetical protein BFW38_00230 [Terasakiispira papahanaumokuakeensis]|uniref:DUF4347 domain-containing protein n=1 Tax=Terasakiispira papahanaumokuakeensis TaxID=197479 RepID=A0A1E2V6B5_9GAMM|nr:DUF4347 domain-containing protein [Terasakiispira papahanaumokuakeensis]ODC02205.1 hypothetical protein BFW38_00230 [Terasakiispira papahanaumokuakeensis]
MNLSHWIDRSPAVLSGHYETLSMTRVYFIDAAIADAQTLINGIEPGAEVVRLWAGMDGIHRMADYLAGHRQLDTIHLMANGSSGCLYLGNTVLNQDSLIRYVEPLHRIGQALKSSGDILIYGENVAQGEAGHELLEGLYWTTKANIAASSTPLGGTHGWVLDTLVGDVTSEIGISSSALDTFSKHRVAE